MALLDRTRQLAVAALIEKLKIQIEDRVRLTDSAGSAGASWHLLEELKNNPAWTADRFTADDARSRDQVLANYKRGLEKLKSAEAETWAAVENLLQN